MSGLKQNYPFFENNMIILINTTFSWLCTKENLSNKMSVLNKKMAADTYIQIVNLIYSHVNSMIGYFLTV